MAADIIPFESNAALPAFMQQAAPGNLAEVGGVRFPVVSIKGKVFTLNKGGEKTLIKKPGEDEPAGSIEVVIIDYSPHGNTSARIFYAKGYEEGNTEKPDCYSNDGVAPAADAVAPQNNKCALCPRNVKGSKPTANNPEGKACSSSKRLAIATADNLDEPMLLRAPGDSVVPFLDYLKVIKERGVPNTYGVVTKIGFDYTVAHPKLTFKPIGFVNAAQYAEAGTVAATDVIQSILGNESVEARPQLAKPAPAAADDDTPIPPKADVKVEAEPAPAPTKPKPAPKPAPKPVEKPAPAPVPETTT
jgi:hypothetical protein